MERSGRHFEKGTERGSSVDLMRALKKLLDIRKHTRADSELLDILSDAYDQAAIDRCHGSLIFGSCVSAKPNRILELGTGTGFITRLLLCAIRYNGGGFLTTLDHGKEKLASKAVLKLFRESGVEMIDKDEQEFCCAEGENRYDFLVSDANHYGNWFEEHFRITSPGSLCFFHDTNTLDYPGLVRLESYVRKLGWAYHHFRKSTRADENCSRGLLMVVNQKRG